MNLLMETGTIIGICVGGGIALLVIILIIAFITMGNKFVILQNQYEEAFSTMDVYLKKRFDLIPNLVETVKGYAKHESEALEKVIAARSRAVTNIEKIEADAQLSQSIRNVQMVAERYPELRANTNFLDLQNQLKLIENEIANSRKYYNATVKAFNTKLGLFPSSIVAKMKHLTKQPLYEIDVTERQNVQVKF